MRALLDFGFYAHAGCARWHDVHCQRFKTLEGDGGADNSALPSPS